MWRDTPPPDDLRDIYPDLALNLDTEYLVECLKKLGIKHSRRYKKKTATIEIAMQPNHLLRLTPTDKGSHGVAEWLTWFWVHGDSCETPILKYSIRAHIEIEELSIKEGDHTISFTTHQDDIEQLIRSAMEGMRHLTGLRIKPVLNQKRTV